MSGLQATGVEEVNGGGLSLLGVARAGVGDYDRTVLEGGMSLILFIVLMAVVFYHSRRKPD